MRRLMTAVAVAAIAVTPTASIAAASGDAASAVPAALVGKWTRIVTPADNNRQGGGLASGRWKITIDRRATVTFNGPNGELVAGTVAVHGNRIVFAVAAPTTGSYSWKRTGSKVTFKLVADPSGDRRAVVVGAWTKA